uniref:Uncharacterized protein n=1 Tax=Poecilia mexicana TaxID=48701 RepID=A0A3B3YBA2_9TELE
VNNKKTISFCFIHICYLFIFPYPHFSSDLLEYGDDEEDLHDTTVNQMLVPRSHQEDATLILNNLLREYDKTLRPDIGGKSGMGKVGY